MPKRANWTFNQLYEEFCILICSVFIIDARKYPMLTKRQDIPFLKASGDYISRRGEYTVYSVWVEKFSSLTPDCSGATQVVKDCKGI